MKNVFDGSKYEDENLGFCPQGSIFGIKALGFRTRKPNVEADLLGLNKDGRAQRGVPRGHRPVDNSKRRGRKAMKKKHRKFRELMKSSIDYA
jgi:hypothetical protein